MQAGIALYALQGHEMVPRQNIAMPGALASSVFASIDNNLYLAVARTSGVSVRRWVESSFRADPAISDSLDIIWVPGQFLERVQDIQLSAVTGCTLFVSGGVMYLAVARYANEEGTSRAPVLLYR